MKIKYHIVVDGQDKQELESCLQQLGAEYEAIYRTSYGDRMDHHYFAELTKYELLYLRLACTTGKIIDIAAREEIFNREIT